MKIPEQYNFEKDIDVPSKQIIIDGIDVNALYSDQIACMNRYEVAHLFIKTVEQLKAKEQECESWKTLIDQAQIEQRKLEQQLEAYKMEAEEGKEINAELKEEQNKIKTICNNHFDEYEMGCLDLSDAIESLLERYDNAITGLTKQRKELKAENEKLKQYKEVVDKLAGMQVILTNENGVPQLYDNAKDLKLKQLSKTLTEIKEIAEEQIPYLDIDKPKTMIEIEYDYAGKIYNLEQRMYKILQKISEVEDV